MIKFTVEREVSGRQIPVYMYDVNTQCRVQVATGVRADFISDYRTQILVCLMHGRTRSGSVIRDAIRPRPVEFNV